MKTPVRIQLSRRRGWRLPLNTVVVSRPSRWGNPFRAMDVKTRPKAVERYRKWFNGRKAIALRADAIRCLRGKNLACWCPVDGSCHADVLLEYVNASELENAAK